jgi:hypothetical protein
MLISYNLSHASYESWEEADQEMEKNVDNCTIVELHNKIWRQNNGIQSHFTRF